MSAVTLPDPKPGCFWHELPIGGHATLHLECRWEEVETFCGTYRDCIVESVYVHPHVVKASAFCETQVELWSMEIVADAEDAAEMVRVDQQRDAAEAWRAAA